MQAAIPWHKEYVGELTKTNTSIPFITGIPNNFVGLYIDFEFKMLKSTEINFMNIIISQSISLGSNFDDIFYITLLSSREVNVSERIVKDKIYFLRYRPAYYEFDSSPHYIKMSIIPDYSAKYIYASDNVTSTLNFIGENYVSFASVKVYKLLAN